MQIFLKCLDGKLCTVDIDNNATVSELREKVTNLTGYNDQIRLVCGGRQLEAGHTLQEYSIGDQYTVHAVGRLYSCDAYLAAKWIC